MPTPARCSRCCGTHAGTPDEMRDEVRSHVLDNLAGGGALIVDETGLPKKGGYWAGVQRQHTGAVGRIDAQAGVVPVHTSARGQVLIERRLHLPERTWSQECQRRRVPASQGWPSSPPNPARPCT